MSNEENNMQDSHPNTQDAEQEEYLDILGNNLILKKTLKYGLGRDSRPNHGEVVTIVCLGKLDDGTLVDCYDELTFILGDGDVIQAFDLALSLAERQEEFELITESRFAYGERGREPDIPPSSRITFWIKLLRTDDAPDYSQMSVDKLIVEADKKRDRGNFLYRDGYPSYNLIVHNQRRGLKMWFVQLVQQLYEDAFDHKM